MLKAGNKIVCVNDNVAFMTNKLTHGKIYSIEKVLTDYPVPGFPIITVMNDNGELENFNFASYRFILLEKSRRLKLEKICSKLTT